MRAALVGGSGKDTKLGRIVERLAGQELSTGAVIDAFVDFYGLIVSDKANKPGEFTIDSELFEEAMRSAEKGGFR